MKTTIWKQSFTIAAFALATSGSVYAGGFVDILSSGARTPGSTNNTNTDPFYLGDLPTSWTLQASQTSTVYSPVNSAAVGSFIDSVWYESSTNSYILGSYFQLNNDINGITEINSIVRNGFADYTGTLSAAWVYASDVYSTAPSDGYKLLDPSRSGYIQNNTSATDPTTVYNATDAANGAYLDLDKVAIRTDVSIDEDAPNSALYLIKFSADKYTVNWTTDAVQIVQGASRSEGGRIRQNMFLDGFAVTAVPEAETYAMMMAGLAMIGSIVRRRKSA